MDTFSFPMAVIHKSDRVQLSAKQGWTIGVISIVAIGLTILVFAAHLPDRIARDIVDLIRLTLVMIGGLVAFFFKVQWRAGDTKIVIAPDGLSVSSTQKTAMPAAPAKRAFDEFDHIEVTRKAGDEYHLYKIILRGKAGSGDIDFDQPGTVGEAHAYNFARQLAQISNLEVKGNEWDN